MYTPPSAKAVNFRWNHPSVNEVVGDPLDNYVKLFIPCNVLQDVKGHSITLNNTNYPPTINFGNSRDGTGCLSLIGDNVSSSTTYCYMSGNDFLLQDDVNSCIELWINFTKLPTNTNIISVQSDSWINWSIEINNSNIIQLKIGNNTGNSQVVLLGTEITDLNVWNHYAFVKIGKAWKFFLNGIEKRYAMYNMSLGHQINNPYLLNIGKPINNIRPIMYLDDIRITVGSTRYLTDFNLINSNNYIFTKSGIVYNKQGVPDKRLIRLYRRNDGKLINETYSDSITGEWTLTTPYPDAHFIIAFDETGAVNSSVIVDRV